MRVLHVHSGNIYGGVETVLYNLAHTRDQFPSMEPHYALCYEGRLTEELESCGVAVTVLGDVRVRKPWTVHRARRALADLIRNTRPDVVVCHAPWALAMFGTSVREAGAALAFFLHGTTTGKHWLERWARRNPPDVAICNCQFTVPSLSAVAPNAPHHVAYYPIPAPPPLSDEERFELRRQLNVDRSTPVIIQVSRLDPWKGHELHLEALARLTDLPDWRCWFVGGPQNRTEERYFERLRSMAAERGVSDRIQFLGQRSDVPKLLAAADVFCQPNTGPEPFGIVFVEALYAGLPVVTSAFGGPIEIVDTSCSILTPPGDVAAVSGALRGLIQDPVARRKLAVGAPDRAAAVCGPAAGLEQLHDALATVARSR